MYTTTRQSNLNTMLSFQNSTTFSTFRLTAVHETASTIESDAAIKPIVSMCVPLIKAPRDWKTPLCPTKQEHHNHNMSSVEHCQQNRGGRPDKPREDHFRNAQWKARTPSTKHHTTRKKLACSTSMHCNVILLAQIENKLWFIHQKPRARRSSHLMSRSQTMLLGHFSI